MHSLRDDAAEYALKQVPDEVSNSYTDMMKVLPIMSLKSSTMCLRDTLQPMQPQEML